MKQQQQSDDPTLKADNSERSTVEATVPFKRSMTSSTWCDSTSCEESKECDDYSALDALIQQEVAKLSGQTRILQQDSSSLTTVAQFDRDEVVLSALLGQGAFSQVHLVWGFSNGLLLRQQQESPSLSSSEQEQQAARDALAYDATNEHTGYSKYVMKHLRHDMPPEKFVHAASDLVMESKFLFQFFGTQDCWLELRQQPGQCRTNSERQAVHREQ